MPTPTTENRVSLFSSKPTDEEDWANPGAGRIRPKRGPGGERDHPSCSATGGRALSLPAGGRAGLSPLGAIARLWVLGNRLVIETELGPVAHNISLVLCQLTCFFG